MCARSEYTAAGLDKLKISFFIYIINFIHDVIQKVYTKTTLVMTQSVHVQKVNQHKLQ